MKHGAREDPPPAQRPGPGRASPAPPRTPWPCSRSSRPRSRSTAATSSAPPSSWPRSGAPTACCAAWRRSWSWPTASRRSSSPGAGDVIAPDDGIVAVGSGGPYALAAARALARHTALDAPDARPGGHEDRRADLHLHQRPDRGGEPLARWPIQPARRPPARSSPRLDGSDARARSWPSSTATSSARPRPSARSRSRSATASAASACRRRWPPRSRPRTSS